MGWWPGGLRDGGRGSHEEHAGDGGGHSLVRGGGMETDIMVEETSAPESQEQCFAEREENRGEELIWRFYMGDHWRLGARLVFLRSMQKFFRAAFSMRGGAGGCG